MTKLFAILKLHSRRLSLALPLSQTLSSAVVQVYTADRNSSWNKRCCGVACLVKDNPQRSYFIRVFDIKVSLHKAERGCAHRFIVGHEYSS